MVKIALVTLALAAACDDRDAKPSNMSPEHAVEPERPAARPVDAAPLAPDAAEVALEVTTQKLWADYDANEVSADERYRGKLLMVTGIVRAISKNFADEVYLDLSAGGSWRHVYATLSDTTEAAKLEKGERVTVRCRGQGKTVEPILGGCAIVSVYKWTPK